MLSFSKYAPRQLWTYENRIITRRFNLKGNQHPNSSCSHNVPTRTGSIFAMHRKLAKKVGIVRNKYLMFVIILSECGFNVTFSEWKMHTNLFDICLRVMKQRSISLKIDATNEHCKYNSFIH